MTDAAIGQVKAQARVRPALVGVVAAAALAAFAGPRALALVALAALFWPMARAGLRRVERGGPAPLALFFGLALALGALQARYLIEAKSLQFSDFMICRSLAIQIADALRAGAVFAPFRALSKSVTDEYSLLSALVPGFALSLAPQSRFVFQAALTACYAVPAVLALGWWSTRLAGCARADARTLAVATAIVVLAAPGAITAVAYGMPDIGGVALVVLALHLGDRLVTALTTRGEGAACKAALRLAAALFAMFLFRRWYLFAGVGIGAALAVELGMAWRGLRLRSLLLAAGAGVAALAVLFAPIVLDWASDWQSHDYGSIYAGYNYDFAELIRRFGEWYGLAIAAAALVATAVLYAKTPNRPLRLTLVGCVVAGALQLHVQSPSLQHFYLVLPLLTAPLGAAAILFGKGRLLRAVPIAAALALATLTPVGALLHAGPLLPTAALPPAPRADLSELLRLRNWIEAHATPERRYCVLGSSALVSGVLVDELWQLEPARPPAFEEAKRDTIILPQVDARDGPVGREIERCDWLLVASPEQTSLPEDFMWVAALPAREALEGTGIGRSYQRTGDVFSLIDDVKLIAFEHISPVTDADVEALTARWRAAPRGDKARKAAERFL